MCVTFQGLEQKVCDIFPSKCVLRWSNFVCKHVCNRFRDGIELPDTKVSHPKCALIEYRYWDYVSKDLNYIQKYLDYIRIFGNVCNF